MRQNVPILGHIERFGGNTKGSPFHLVGVDDKHLRTDAPILHRRNRKAQVKGSNVNIVFIDRENVVLRVTNDRNIQRDLTFGILVELKRRLHFGNRLLPNSLIGDDPQRTRRPTIRQSNPNRLIATFLSSNPIGRDQSFDVCSISGDNTDRTLSNAHRKDRQKSRQAQESKTGTYHRNEPQTGQNVRKEIDHSNAELLTGNVRRNLFGNTGDVFQQGIDDLGSRPSFHAS